MNKLQYKTANVIQLKTANDFLKREYMNKLALIESIQNRYENKPRSKLLHYNIEQLEGILEFGSPHAYASKEFTDDRNFITSTTGRVHKGVEIEAGRDFRDWHDMRVMKQIKGYRAYKRIQFSTKDKTPEELKEDKINSILDTIDDQYKMVVKHIREEDMQDLVDLCINKYEVNIRKTIAALLRIRGAEYGQFPTIEEACHALGVGKKDFIAVATELNERGIYTREKINENYEAIIDQAYTMVFDLRKYHPEINDQVTTAIISDLPPSCDYLKEYLETLRLDKVISLVLMVVKRYCDLSPTQLLTPLTKHPGYLQQKLRNGLTSFNTLDKKVPNFKEINFNEKIYPATKFVELFNDSILKTRYQRQLLLETLCEEDAIQNPSTNLDNHLNGYLVEIDLKIQEDNQMKSNNTQKSTITVFCGQEGELYRHQLDMIRKLKAQNKDVDISLISNKSQTAWENITTYLGPQKYRLKKTPIPSFVHFIRTDENFDSLIDEILKYSKLEQMTDMIIISDIRPFINQSNISSNLDIEIKTALTDFAKDLIVSSINQGKLLLKSELKASLNEYKRRFEKDQANSDELWSSYHTSLLMYNPKLKPKETEQIYAWIQNPTITLGCSFSPDLIVGRRGEEEIYYKKSLYPSSEDKSHFLDHVLWKLPQKTYVSAEVGDIHSLRTTSISDSYSELGALSNAYH